MMARTNLNDVTVGYDDRGADDAILFLHAFPMDRTMWDRTADQVATMARAVSMDARGFGESAPASEVLEMETIAEDAARLLDHLHITSAVVCGLSMGGYAALAFARRHPDRVRGLILSDTRASGDTEQARAARFSLIDKIRADGIRALEEAMVERLLGETTRREDAALVESVRATIGRVAPDAAIAALRGLARRRDSTDLLTKIAVPVLFVCGEEDVITSPAEMRELQRMVPESRYVEIARAGHLANLENPEMYRDAIVDFVGNLRL
jgi:pimeloyl-ACP methyl ester carboxylesterase